MTRDLTLLREDIDRIDRELVPLLEKRMDVAAEIAAYKKAHRRPILDPAREEEKLAAVASQCRPETARDITEIFRAVMAASRAYQASVSEGCHE